MGIVFIVNNKNNRLRKLLPGLRSYFEERFPGQVKFLFTLRRKHAVELAKEATEAGCDYLIAVGGDGTLHEVINGLLQCGKPIEDQPVIGLLPLGSANDFARTAGISFSLETLEQWIRNGTPNKIDVGVIRLSSSGEVRYFINMAGIGLGSEVVQCMARSEPFLGAAFHYYLGILKGFRHYAKKKVVCRGNTWQWEGDMLQMAVGNGRYFGNGICVVPEAELADRRLHVAVFGDLSLWDYIKNTGKLKRGKKIEHPQVKYYSTEELYIEGTGCGIEADGEFVGLLPASIAVMPAAVSFLMPTV
jgi:YegS/Rv2252/BmrU family lipid kinase